MKIIELFPNIFHIHFSTRLLLTSTFLRFQEHYESPEFRGKIFSLEEYKKWYISVSPKGKETGKFTYYEDWSGFNIPGYILEPFFEGKFNPLSLEEQHFLKMFEHMRGKYFYIIGTFGDEKGIDVLEHEIAHGFFATNENYKEKVLQTISKLPLNSRKNMEKYLSSSGGYHPSVFDDEIHAYLLTNFNKLVEKKVLTENDRTVSESLWELFEATKTKD